MDRTPEGIEEEMPQQEVEEGMHEMSKGTEQEIQQQEAERMDEQPGGSEQVQQQEAEGMQEADGMDEELEGISSSDELSDLDELEEGMQEADGMDEELEGISSLDELSDLDELEEGMQEAEGINSSDESDESSGTRDWDELEELDSPPLQFPGSIIDDVCAYLPPLTSPSLIAKRPLVELIPCDRRADWRDIPIDALDRIYTHLPLSDIHVMGTVFDENLNAGWCERWLEEDLVLHDAQIHFATYKDVKYYIRKHGGAVNTLRIDKLVFSSQNVRSWCHELRKPEVTGPNEIILMNRGSPSSPLCLEPLPKEILLPFNGRGLKKLHLCFFTLPRGGLHTYVALAGICELGLHGCAYGDDEIADGITSWLNLERLTLSFASQDVLRVVSHSVSELKLCNSSIRILDLRWAVALVRLFDLDLDSITLSIDHLLIRSLTVLDVVVNYTALPEHSQVSMLQVLLNSFPCVQDLTIKRKDNVNEGQMLPKDECWDNIFADMECLTSHLKILSFSDFRGGKWEFALIKVLESRAKKLSVLKVVCHRSCLESTRVETAAFLKEICQKSLDLNASIC